MISSSSGANLLMAESINDDAKMMITAPVTIYQAVPVVDINQSYALQNEVTKNDYVLLRKINNINQVNWCFVSFIVNSNILMKSKNFHPYSHG